MVLSAEWVGDILKRDRRGSVIVVVIVIQTAIGMNGAGRKKEVETQPSIPNGYVIGRADSVRIYPSQPLAGCPYYPSSFPHPA